MRRRDLRPPPIPSRQDPRGVFFHEPATRRVRALRVGARDHHISLGEAKVRVRHIRGIVRNRATGEPVANAVLRLVPRVPSPHALIANTTSDKAGMFDLQGRAVRLNGRPQRNSRDSHHPPKSLRTLFFTASAAVPLRMTQTIKWGLMGEKTTEGTAPKPAAPVLLLLEPVS